MVGSPGLKASLEAQLGDVLNEFAVEKDNKEPIVKGGEEGKVRACCGDALDVPSSSSLASPLVSFANEDSQDSILDIDGVVHDEEVSLMEWNADDEHDAGEPGGHSCVENPVVSVEAPKPHEGIDDSTTVPGISGSWRLLVHRDDPFLSLVPSEVARVASALRDHAHDHLEAYRHLGFSLSGAHSLIEFWIHDTDLPRSPRYQASLYYECRCPGELV